jgi:hypothetical protein
MSTKERELKMNVGALTAKLIEQHLASIIGGKILQDGRYQSISKIKECPIMKEMYRRLRYG